MFRNSRVGLNALNRFSAGGSASCLGGMIGGGSSSSSSPFSSSSSSSSSSSVFPCCLNTQQQRRFKKISGEVNAIFDPTEEANVVEGKKETQQLAAEKSSVRIYTFQHYLDKMEEEEKVENKLKKKAARVFADPHWLLWSTFFVGMTVFGCVAALRIRDEQVKFDPRMRAVTVLEREEGPDIGGPFTLYDSKGKKYTEESFKGMWYYIYFGFTNCPDICPDEMKKLTRVCRSLDRLVGPEYWQPIFVTIDPVRDTPEVLDEYLADFHPRILGLRGPSEDVERAAREFRVYYSIPEEHEDKDTDYLIDHSIIMYLMDPKGKFSDFTTKEFAYSESYSKILGRMVNYEKKQEGTEEYNRRVAIITSPTQEAQDHRNNQKYKGAQTQLASIGEEQAAESLASGPATFGVNR